MTGIPDRRGSLADRELSCREAVEGVGPVVDVEDAGGVSIVRFSMPGERVQRRQWFDLLNMDAFDLGNGHGTLGQAWPMIGLPLWGYSPEITAKFDLSVMDDDQRYVLETNPPTVGNIVPILSYLRVPAPMEPGGPLVVMTTFRVWQPLAPGKLEMWNWQFVWDFQTDEEAQDSYVLGQLLFGSAGTFEQDDTVAWEGSARAAKSAWMQREGLSFNFEQAGRTTVDTSPDPAYHGPGVKRKTGYGEYGPLNFYRRWLELMRGGAAEVATSVKTTSRKGVAS